MELLNKVNEKLKEQFTGDIESAELLYDYPVFTIQKEVAERICAQPPRMNLLAASIQIWAAPEILGIIPPSDFEPPPKVTSAILRLRTKNVILSPVVTGRRISEDFSALPQNDKLLNYYKLIKIIFKQTRKTLLNNLADGLNLPKEEVLKKLTELNLTGQERGQNLSINTLKKLSEFLIQN